MIKTIHAIKTSSKRTKERIKLHGPKFLIESHDENCAAVGGVSAWFVRSQKDGWFGWLPEGEMMLVD